MAYTQAQLTTFFTNANTGVAPTAAQSLALQAYATQSASGQLTDAQALDAAIALGANTTSAVGVQTYAFFTGVAPSVAGLTELNKAYSATGIQANLNGENRFIAQSVALATQNTAAKTAFTTSYGSLSLVDATKAAYNIIIGAPAAAAAGVNVDAAVAYLTRAENVTYLNAFIRANTGLTAAADIDLAVKAAIIGQIMQAATTYNNGAGLGAYAQATDKLLADLADDGSLVANNAAGINLFAAYGSGGSTGGTPGSTVSFTAGVDNLVGTANDDTFNGTQLVTAGAVVAGTAGLLATTYQAADTVAGGAGVDTLNLTITNPAGAATGTTTVTGAGVSGVENIVIRSTTDTAADTVTVDGTGFVGAAQIVNDRSVANFVVNSMAAGVAAGLTGNNAVTLGTLSANYAAGTSAVTLNLSGGTGNNATTPVGPNVVFGGVAGVSATASAATVATINSTGAANLIGTLQLAGTGAGVAAETVRTLNINASTGLTTGAVTGFGSGSAANSVGAINVTGTGAVSLASVSAAGASANFQTLNISTGSGTVSFGTGFGNGIFSGTAAAINVSGAAATTNANTASVTLGTVGAAVKTINASGLTAGGVSATIGANTATIFTGGQGTDVITIGATGLTGTINAGAGSDIIAFTDGTYLVAGLTPLVSGFEILRVGGTAGVAFDPTLIAGITSYQVTTGTSVQLNNLVANPTVTVIGNQTTGLTLNQASAAGASDAINLRLDNLATTGANVNGVTVAALSTGGNATAGQIETLNITSAGRVTGTGTYNQVTLAASGAGPNYADANTVNLSGAAGVTLITGATQHAQKIDASTHTGGVVITNTTAAGSAAGVFTLIGSAVNDTIDSANVATIYGGAGGDRIVAGAGVQTITYKAASDSTLDLAGTTTAGANGIGASGVGGTVNGSKMDVIETFNAAATDKLDFSTFGFGTGGLGGGIVDKGTAATDAAFNALLTGAGLFTDGVTQRAFAVIHGTAGMSSGVAGDFLIVDANKDGAFNAATDIVIKLTGTTGTLDITDFVI